MQPFADKKSRTVANSDQARGNDSGHVRRRKPWRCAIGTAWKQKNISLRCSSRPFGITGASAVNSARRAIILTIILAFLAGIGGAFLGIKLLASPPPRDNALHALLHEELKLSAAQDNEIADEEKRFALRRAQLEADAHNANIELAEAIQATKRNGPEVQKAIEHVHTALGNYQKASIGHIFRMRAVLTPEQASVFDRSVGQALMQEPQ